MCMHARHTMLAFTFSSLLDRLLLRISSVHSLKQRSTRLEYILRLQAAWAWRDVKFACCYERVNGCSHAHELGHLGPIVV